MKEFNNAKMTEEELDQVAGGQKYIVLDRQADGKIVYDTYGFEGDIEAAKALLRGESVSGVSFTSSSGHGGVKADQLERFIQRRREMGYVVIKKWEL